MSNMEERSVEARVRALELRLGLDGEGGQQQQSLLTRLDALEQELPKDCALPPQEMFQSESQPLYWRKQQVLASQNALRRDMKQLADILNLLYVASKAPTNEKNSMADTILHAPILQPLTVSEREEVRLTNLRTNILECQKEAASLIQRVDRSVSVYQTVVRTLNQRLVQQDN